MMKTYKYIRVSTLGQNTERQLDKSCKMFVDKCSGLIPFKERAEASTLLNVLNTGDTLIIESVDRLGRDKMDMLTVLDELKQKQVNVKVENLGIESILPNGKYNSVFDIITTLLSSISAYEKEQITERTRQGIEIAKLNGVYKGRAKGSSIPVGQYLRDNSAVVSVIKKYPEMSLRALAKLAGVSHSKVKKIKALV